MQIEQKLKTQFSNQEDKSPEYELLSKKVYPLIENALKKFIENIKDSDEIEKHIEKIKRQRIIDQNEIEKLEKEKMKKELGDDYISSQSDEDISENEDLNSSRKNSNFKIDSNINIPAINNKDEHSVILEDVRNEISEKGFSNSRMKFDSLNDRSEFNPLKLFVKFLEDEVKESK